MQKSLSYAPWLSTLGAVALLAVVAWLTDQLAKRAFRGFARRVAARTRSTWDDHIIDRRVFGRIAHVLPALVTYYGVGLALGVAPGEEASAALSPFLAVTYLLVRRVSLAFIVFTSALAASGLLSAIDDIYRETYAEAKSRPIKGYLQVVKIFLFITAGVWMVSIVADRSPIVFISGLGALTAVLMLVFRDTILSLVASLQITSNDMIRIGDWVEMPQANADGDVIDIALHTVKIQNWDKTITTIPTYRFITDSFRNWRGMSESGGRRIKRPLHLDLNTIHFLTDEEFEHLSRYEFLRDYMRRKREELAEANARDPGDPDVIPERRRLTNVGTFRAYVLHYLRNHPRVHQGMTLLVRQLEPGPKGLPIEIYCFSRDTAWAHYEALQADIFDHLIAILPEFGLRPFQEPTGADVQALGQAAEGGAGG